MVLLMGQKIKWTAKLVWIKMWEVTKAFKFYVIVYCSISIINRHTLNMINIIFGLCWLEKNRKQKVTDAFKIIDLVIHLVFCSISVVNKNSLSFCSWGKNEANSKMTWIRIWNMDMHSQFCMLFRYCFRVLLVWKNILKICIRRQKVTDAFKVLDFAINIFLEAFW